jgi:hypothetical protein
MPACAGELPALRPLGPTQAVACLRAAQVQADV